MVVQRGEHGAPQPFRPAAPRELHEQGGDQRRLRRAQRRRAEDVPPVRLPHGRLPAQQDRPRRQAGLGHPPPPELPPVGHGHERDVDDGDVLDAGPLQDANGHSARFLGQGLLATTTPPSAPAPMWLATIT